MYVHTFFAQVVIQIVIVPCLHRTSYYNNIRCTTIKLECYCCYCYDDDDDDVANGDDGGDGGSGDGGGMVVVMMRMMMTRRQR